MSLLQFIRKYLLGDKFTSDNSHVVIVKSLHIGIWAQQARSMKSEKWVINNLMPLINKIEAKSLHVKNPSDSIVINLSKGERITLTAFLNYQLGIITDIDKLNIFPRKVTGDIYANIQNYIDDLQYDN